jgi:hypothetical protein
MLRDAVAELGGAVLQVVQVEPAQHRAILGHEHVEGAGAGLLLGDRGAVPVGELVEELLAAVGDRGREPGPVGQLERQHRGGIVRIQRFQLGHGPTLPGWPVELTQV